MEAAVESGRGRWSTAIGLTVVVLLLSVFDGLALVALPLALLLVALPAERRLRWILIGAAVWSAAVLFPGGALAALSRGWALMLGATFLAITLVRADWGVLARALTTVAAALGAAIAGLTAAGQAGAFDALVREHFQTVSGVTIAELRNRLPDSTWVAELQQATEQVARLQADLFPALLALQSLAALALAAWWVRRLGRSESASFNLGRLRDFRFNDQLIWVLIGALVVVLLPLGAAGTRIALNGIVFMGALYALRGLAVFVYLASGSGSVTTMVFGALALIFLYPVAFTAALLMGVGDTWLDVRNRVT